MIKAAEYFNPKDFNGSILLANALQYENYIEKALDVFSKIKDDLNETPFFRAFCYAKLKDELNCSREVNLFISQMGIVSRINFERVFNIICAFFESDNAINLNFKELIEKPFELNAYKELIQNVVLMLSHDENANPKRVCDIAKTSDISNNIKASTAYILLEKNEPHLSVDLYRQFIDKQKYDRDLFYYIQALYYTKKDNKELLDLLKDWRLNANQYDELLLQWEYTLRGQLNDWKGCLDIAEIIYNRHPDKDSVISNYLFCLNKNEEKVKELIENISSTNFSNLQAVRNVAIIMHQNGYVEKAFEFLYPFAKNRENSELRTLYFTFCLRIKNESILKLYDIVSEGTYVLIQYEDTLSESLIQVDPGNTSNEIQQALIGKSEGGTVSLKMPVSGIYREITIKQIMNKHLALHRELCKDTENPLESNLAVTSFQLPEDSKIEDFFVKSFAAGENVRKKTIKEFLEQFKRGEVPYSMIITLFQGDYLKTYSILSTKEYGILLNPHIQNMNMVDLKNKEFVLDFSSFFCIYDIYKELNLTPPHKFIISNAIKDFIVDQINEVQNTPEAELGIDIDFDGIQAIPYPKGYKKIQVEYLERIISWIEQYCTVVFVEERLDEIRGRDDESNARDNGILSYIADYMHILNQSDRILITDDALLYSQHAQQNVGISSQHYLKTFFEESIINAEFLKRNYIGVPVDQNFLKNEFIKKTIGAENTYLKCLDSLCYLLPSNKNMGMNIICAFLKDIYTDTIVIEDINRETIFFFTKILKSISDTPFLMALSRHLLHDFKLLGLKRDTILKNYMIALNILFPKSNYSFD